MGGSGQFPEQIIYILNLIHAYGYYIIFPLIVIEGPGTIFVSGFIISLGYLNPITTYFVIVAADLFGDILYYVSGRWWIHGVSRKVLAFFKMSPEKFDKFKKAFVKHSRKIMFFGKLSSFIGGLVMYLAGFLEVPFSEFILVNGFGALFKTLLLLAAGFYFGSIVMHLSGSIDLLSTVFLLLFSVLCLGIYNGITSIANRYIKRAGGLKS